MFFNGIYIMCHGMAKRILGHIGAGGNDPGTKMGNIHFPQLCKAL